MFYLRTLCLCLAGSAQTLHHHNGRKVIVPAMALKQSRDLTQCLISCGMTIAVVKTLKVININQCQYKRLSCSLPASKFSFKLEVKALLLFTPVSASVMLVLCNCSPTFSAPVWRSLVWTEPAKSLSAAGSAA